MKNIKFWADHEDDTKSFFNALRAHGNEDTLEWTTVMDKNMVGWFVDEIGMVTFSRDTLYFDSHRNKEFFFPIPGPLLEDVVETNPKQQHGQSSIPLSLFSPLATAYGSLGKLNGKLKYGLSNFVATPVIASIYVDAIRRHLDKWMSGEEVDSADGVPHFGAILANVDILLCARAAGSLVDDRPQFKGYQEEITKLAPIVKNLYEIHSDKQPKHYYLKDQDGSK